MPFISVDFYFINIILVKHYLKFISFLKKSWKIITNFIIAISEKLYPIFNNYYFSNNISPSRIFKKVNKFLSKEML